MGATVSACCVPNLSYDFGVGDGLPFPFPAYCNMGSGDYLCNSDGECPIEWGLNGCDKSGGLPGKCVTCTKDAHCADGVCEGGECIPCREDANCSGGTPVCVNTNCLACRVDSDCPANDPACTSSNTCITCISDEHCSDPAKPVCVDSPFFGSICSECGTDADCNNPAEPRCLDDYFYGEKQCVECIDDTDCGGFTPGCGASSVCVECSLDEHCVEGEVCDSETCIIPVEKGLCESCASDAECKDGTACRAARSSGGGSFTKCRTECMDSPDCSRSINSLYNGLCGDYMYGDYTTWCGCNND
jgi:Cys-rich repeat protein